MSTIYVGFSKSIVSVPILAWIIMACERVNFSHAYIRIRSDSLDRDLIYQATGSGVYFVGMEYFHQHSATVEEYALEVSDEAKKQFLRWAIDMSGKPYGRLQCLGIGIRRLAMLVGIKMKNPFSTGNKAYVCTEVVAEAVKELGMPIGQSLDDVGLRELVHYVRSLVLFQRKV